MPDWDEGEWVHLGDLKARSYIVALEKEIEELKQWVNDLQSGMWINCVYCGHRYGPGDSTPATMADALKAHIEQCPKHPMSELKRKLAVIEAQKPCELCAAIAELCTHRRARLSSKKET